MYYIETRLQDGWVCVDYTDNGIMRQYATIDAATLAMLRLLNTVKRHSDTKVRLRVRSMKV